MSATKIEAKASSPEAPSRRIKPISQSIILLDNDSARLYTHVHPALLLGSLYFSFNKLVNNPVTTLFWALFPLTLLQVVYCITCLPPSNGSSAQAAPITTPRRKRVQFAKTQASTGSRITTAAFAIFLTLTLGAPLLTIILILFGAPFLTHFWHNVLCATHIAVLGVLPLFYVYGVNARMWREISGACLPFDEVWGATVGAMVGSWVGAVPIPLDWDRDWQAWPITIVIGAYIGWALLRLAGAYILRGKRINFDE